MMCRGIDMGNSIVCFKLIFLLVAALIVTIVGVFSFIPYAVFRICKKLHEIIEKKVEDLKWEVD